MPPQRGGKAPDLSNAQRVGQNNSTTSVQPRYKRESWVDGDGVRWMAVWEYDQQLSRWVLVSRFEAEHS